MAIAMPDLPVTFPR